MIRADMISKVGREFLTTNIENDEYSYPKAFSAAALTFFPIKNNSGRKFEKLDIRFEKDGITVLIETKQNFSKADEEQLSAYVEYEKALTGNKIIAILANTNNDNVKVWRGVVSDSDLMPKETALRTMDEYVDFYTSKINDKEKVMQNTYKLNELLHRHSVPEKLRSQFVGTCLLALKNGLDYSTPSLTAAQIRTRIKEVFTQCQNYIYAVEQEANSVKFIERVGCKVIKPRCTLVYGRSNDWDDEKKEAFRILNSAYNQLSIITYDQLLERAKNMLNIDNIEKAINEEKLPF